MILLGVCGFSYEDWIGPVYPPGLPKSSWLSFIAGQVDSIELNVTFYAYVAHRTVSGWAERTPPDFTFSAKLHRDLTHERGRLDCRPFLEQLQPLREAGKLACVLAQFPYSFKPTEANRAYLGRLKEGMGDLQLVVEFRERGWLSPETFDELQLRQIGYCAVDEPQIGRLMPPMDRVTAPIGYVRFHGRNAAKWWSHEHAWERYDYSYREQELEDWVPRLQQMEQQAARVMVYANNHYRGQALNTLRILRRLLARAGG
jgi:uncharacterized protein YecE (DUF72 family)